MPSQKNARIRARLRKLLRELDATPASDVFGILSIARRLRAIEAKLNGAA